jgi:eukaryotic-like serine/threonine-protein kinase
MKQVLCEKCSRVLEFSGDQPSFCGFCGQPLGPLQQTTSEFASSAATLPPTEPHTSDAVNEQDESRAPHKTAREPAPQVVGGYRLLRQLGSGGMGEVHEAEELASGRRVALKLISPFFTQAPDALERFRQEGRIASMISHPRCVFVHSVAEDQGRPYIVMELMPGSTLKDMVDRDGPMPPTEAIAKIVDVMEGLQAAHRLEVIHRDVKPSNCFLEPDGRVKVGDFGLAKSLVKDSHLTKTGAFLGTPHFASPEQVRGDPADQQTDVYAVAATLYYLLTGKPPFWGTDSSATLARIVADPAPSLRQLRPDVSPALDQVVLRGLERDRKRRWPDLETFRQALLGLRPEPLSVSDLGLRCAAIVFDGLLLWVIVLLLLWPLTHVSLPESFRAGLMPGLFLVLFFAYFTATESIRGCSLGKWLLRLRVCGSEWIDPPSLKMVLARTAIFSGLLMGGVLLTSIPALGEALAWLPWAWGTVGLAVMAGTMRGNNSFRGLHEVVSGTRVARRPAPRERPLLLGSGGWLLSFLGRRLDRGGGPGKLPERIGRFTIRGVLKWEDAEKVLLGEDEALGRRVLLWLRPQSAPPLDPVRRDLGRRARLRWLACGRQSDLQWDALLAPSGCPLPDFVRSEGRLNWPETRLLLEDLARELRLARTEGSLPRQLTTGQIWVQGDGRCQVADLPLRTPVSAAEPLDDSARVRDLLRRTAMLALEGTEPAGAGAMPPTIAAFIEQLGLGSAT